MRMESIPPSPHGSPEPTTDGAGEHGEPHPAAILGRLLRLLQRPADQDQSPLAAARRLLPNDKRACLAVLERVLIELRLLRKEQYASEGSSATLQQLLEALELILAALGEIRTRSARTLNVTSRTDSRLLAGCVQELSHVLNTPTSPSLARKQVLRLVCRLVERRANGTAFRPEGAAMEIVRQRAVRLLVFAVPLVDDESRKYILRSLLSQAAIFVDQMAEANAERVLLPLLDNFTGTSNVGTLEQDVGPATNCLLAVRALLCMASRPNGALCILAQPSAEETVVRAWDSATDLCFSVAGRSAGSASARSPAMETQLHLCVPLASLVQELSRNSPEMMTRLAAPALISRTLNLFCSLVAMTHDDRRVECSQEPIQPWVSFAIEPLARFILSVVLQAQELPSSATDVLLDHARMVVHCSIELLDAMTTVKSPADQRQAPDVAYSVLWTQGRKPLVSATLGGVLLDLLVATARLSDVAFAATLREGVMPLIKIMMATASWEEDVEDIIGIRDRSLKLLNALCSHDLHSVDYIGKLLCAEEDLMPILKFPYALAFLKHLVDWAAADITRNRIDHVLSPPRALRLVVSLARGAVTRNLLISAGAPQLISVALRALRWTETANQAEVSHLSLSAGCLLAQGSTARSQMRRSASRTILVCLAVFTAKRRSRNVPAVALLERVRLALSLALAYRYDRTTLNELCFFEWGQKDEVATDESKDFWTINMQNEARVLELLVSEASTGTPGFFSIVPLLIRLMLPSYPKVTTGSSHLLNSPAPFDLEAVDVLHALASSLAANRDENSEIFFGHLTNVSQLLRGLVTVMLRIAVDRPKEKHRSDALMRIVVLCLTRQERLIRLVLGNAFAEAAWPLVNESSAESHIEVTETGAPLTTASPSPQRNPARPSTAVVAAGLLSQLRNALTCDMPGLQRIIQEVLSGGDDVAKLQEHAAAALAICCPPEMIRNTFLGLHRLPQAVETEQPIREGLAVKRRHASDELSPIGATLSTDAPVGVLARMLCYRLDYESESVACAASGMTRSSHWGNTTPQSAKLLGIQRRRTAALAFECIARPLTSRRGKHLRMLLESHNAQPGEVQNDGEISRNAPDNQNWPQEGFVEGSAGNDMADENVTFYFPDEAGMEVVASRHLLARASQPLSAMLLGKYAEGTRHRIAVHEVDCRAMRDLVDFVSNPMGPIRSRPGSPGLTKDRARGVDFEAGSMLGSASRGLTTLESMELFPAPESFPDNFQHWTRAMNLMACADRFLVLPAKNACELWLLNAMDAWTATLQSQGISASDKLAGANAIVRVWAFCTKLYAGRSAFRSQAISSTTRNPVGASALRHIVSMLTLATCGVQEEEAQSQAGRKHETVEPLLPTLWEEDSVMGHLYMEQFVDGIVDVLAEPPEAPSKRLKVQPQPSAAEDSKDTRTGKESAGCPDV